MQRHLAASAAFLVAATVSLSAGAQALRTADTKKPPFQLRVPLQRRSAPSSSSSGEEAGALSFLQTAKFSGVSSGAGNAETTEALNGAPEVDIFGQIRVGTPPQTFDVAIDTGSSNLLLTSAACRSVGCLAHNTYSAAGSSTAKPLPLALLGTNTSQEGEPETVFLDISTGQAEGNLVEDVVCLGTEGDVCAATGLVQMTKMTQAPFNVFPYDGILGVGMPEGSLDKRFNFLGNLAESDKLRRDRFSVWMANENDTENSEIIFGELAQEKLGSEILWLPVSQYDTGMWQAKMDDFAVENTLLGLCGTQGCQAAFDTGTNAIGGPPETIDGILEALDIKQDCTNFASLPILGFSFRGTILSIDKYDYVKKVDDRCYHQFLKISLTGKKKDMILLGDPFLKKYVTTFDRGSLQTGVALSVHRIPLGWDTNIAQEAARLIKQPY